MVAAVRRGASMRSVARDFGTSVSVVHRWVQRAEGRRLDRVDWRGTSRRPHTTSRTSPGTESLVLEVRRSLRDHSVLGEYGASVIADELRRCHDITLSRSTVARILRRHGVVEKSSRQRGPAPPRGWYLPDVREGQAELDSWDFVEGLVIRGGPRLFILTVTSLHGGLPGAFVRTRHTAAGALEGLLEHWRRHGLPRYAQFDNDTAFQGPHQRQSVVGRVSRACLALGVTPVFAPPREHGPQNAVEGFNGLWQRKLWQRHEWTSIEHLQGGSDVYVQALIARRCARIATAPARLDFPPEVDVDAPLSGSIVYLRRVAESAMVNVLGCPFDVPSEWSNCLVRAVVDLDSDQIRIYGLSRRTPAEQPLIQTVPHSVPRPQRRDRS